MSRIHTAPPGTGTVTLGKTLPDLLYAACDRFDQPTAFNQPEGGAWKPWSLDQFRRQAEELALGLHALGLDRGDHVGLYLESDVYFGLGDMGCLLAGLVDVPIYLTQPPEVIAYVLDHAGVQALMVSTPRHLQDVAHVLRALPRIHTVIVMEGAPDATAPPDLGDTAVRTLKEVQAQGRRHGEEHPGALRTLREAIRPHDLATLIYTSGTTGRPKGVMLSHENISSNALAAFSGLKTYRPGPEGEVALSFLPLTHIFARTLHYGFVAHGTSVYFTSPEQLAEDLTKVRPTALATVPRLLEKVYGRIQERTLAMQGAKGHLGRWALELARRYELGQEPEGAYKLQLHLADALVFKKWRAALGGRMRFVITGGAALNAELANVFCAAGVPIMQGYGLTESSPVIAFNRPDRNRAGTVGEPMAGVEVKIADDGEILTRGPHVMQGYYKDEEKTRAVLTEDGWLHTGDIGEMVEGSYLRITDRKKDLFKLSTGKYVVPQPLESRLAVEALIEQVVVVGEGRKFTTALIFPSQDALYAFAERHGLDTRRSFEELLQAPEVVAAYDHLVQQANEGMEPWSTIKRFVLVPEQLSVENGLLTPTLKVKRAKVRERFLTQIDRLYSVGEAPAARPETDGHLLTS